MEAVASLSLLSDDIENGVDELGTLSVIYERGSISKGQR